MHVWGSDSCLFSELFPSIVWALVGRKDQLFRPTCTKEFKHLSKRMVPFFLPESMQKPTEDFWVEKIAEMTQVDGSDLEREEQTLPFFKGYLYSSSFMMAVQSIVYEVVAQPHKFDT